MTMKHDAPLDRRANYWLGFAMGALENKLKREYSDEAWHSFATTCHDILEILERQEKSP
jgi:hypothetical protein